MARFNSSAADAFPEPDGVRSLASWYAEGGSDGFGDRLLMFDNSGNASLELLRFRPELAAASGFEEALRRRANQLRQFSEPAFPQIRAVENLGSGGLALVSTFSEGKRLGEIFRSPRPGVHPAFAAWLVRDLTSALFALQRHGKDIAHGALTPERVVITPSGRLMIVEHVLGAALDHLRMSPRQLWLHLGIVAPLDIDGTARIDVRTDVIQLAWIVLSVLVGRRLTSTEYPVRAEALVDEFARVATPRAPDLVAALRRWLERALQVRGEIFGSALDAYEGLAELNMYGGPQPIAFMPRRYTVEALTAHEPPRLPPAEAAPQPIEHEAATETEHILADTETKHSPADTEPSADAERPAHAEMPAMPGTLFSERPTSDLIEDAPVAIAESEPAWRTRVPWILAIGMGTVAVVEAIVLALHPAPGPSVPVAPSVPITFESSAAGDSVIVDGREVGTTPLTLSLTREVGSVFVQARPAPPPPAPVPVSAPAPAPAPRAPERAADPATAAAIAEASARARRGGIQIVSPVEVQVLEGDRVLGSSADGPVIAMAGRHELDFINTAIGYRSHQVVEIAAGKIARMTISPPDGRLSVNAAPWAQVWIDGKLSGDTPLANLPMPPGEHQITFRHPQLGEQTQRVMVKSGAVTRVSATFAR